MFQRIMVPLDGSVLAERAMPCAARLVTALGGVLHVVHVVEPPVKPHFASPYLYDALLAGAREQAEAYLAAQREQWVAAHVPVQTELLCGNAAATLLAYERAAGIDLVVMCSHGRGDLARLASGSVADQLLRHGAVPVLLVRPSGAPTTLERAVVPLDGSARAEEALLAVDQLARYVLREVTLVQAVESPEQAAPAEHYLAEVCRSLSAECQVCRCRVELGDAAWVIGDMARAIGAVAGEDALVVMSTHGRTGLARLALGSVADRVVRHGRHAVLLVRAGTLHATS